MSKFFSRDLCIMKMKRAREAAVSTAGLLPRGTVRRPLELGLQLVPSQMEAEGGCAATEHKQVWATRPTGECVGAGICQRDRIRSPRKDCGGAGICQHSPDPHRQKVAGPRIAAHAPIAVRASHSPAATPRESRRNSSVCSTSDRQDSTIVSSSPRFLW